MQNEPENGMWPGQAEKAGGKNVDESKQDEPFKGELEETETEQLAEDGPAKLLSRYIRHISLKKQKISTDRHGLENVPN